MKYRILFLLTWLALNPLSAENISKDKAEKMALDFFRNNRSQLSISGLQMVYDGETPVSRASGAAPAYYVFNNSNGKGFVIIAGDDIAEPILGYSYENRFQTDCLPPNVKGWLEGMKEQINKGRKAGITSKPSSRVLSRIGKVVVQLKTAKWSQGHPYNMYTPTIDGVHCPTGCVITAGAIIMHYHKWPEKGVGVVPGYTTYTEKINVPSIELGHIYEWNNMLDTYSEAYTAEQAHQVARLMADLGTMFQAEYKRSSTASDEWKIMRNLITYMDYDHFAVNLERSKYSDTVWHEMLCNELRHGRPIVYAGGGDYGGHAFVIDGYTVDNYYSVNWGWGGSDNGYFLLSALNGFNLGQSAILGLKPKTMDVSVGKLFIPGTIQLFSGVIGMNSPFELVVRYRYIGNGDLKFDTICALTDKEGNIKEKLGGSYGWIVNNKEDRTISFPNTIITVPINIGDRLRLFYKPSDTSEWILVRGGEYSIWELPVTEEKTIEETTIVRYNNKNYTLELQTKDGVDVQFASESGVIFSERCTTEGVITTINTHGLHAGTYLLRLTKAVETYEVKIKLGDSK